MIGVRCNVANFLFFSHCVNMYNSLPTHCFTVETEGFIGYTDDK